MTEVSRAVQSLSGTARTSRRLLLRVPEAADMCAIGRTKAYELVASGVWPSIHIGTSVRVPLDGLLAWLEEQLEEQN